MTSDLLVRPAGQPADGGTLVSVTPASAGWGHVGFEVLSLDGSQAALRSTEGKELCVVVVAGRCRVRSEHGDWEIGGRPDPFSGPPEAAYLPPGTDVEVEGSGEVALCWAPADGGAPARVLETGEIEVRGAGAFERRIHPILMSDQPADALLVCEVLTPGGHWSSYPPHKHDRDAMPEESSLEETYLNVMAGPTRAWAIANDPDHEWMLR